MRTRSPRYLPEPTVSAVLISEEDGRRSVEGNIINMHVDGCCIELKPEARALPIGDATVKLKVDGDLIEDPISARICALQTIVPSGSNRYHVFFKTPCAAARPGLLATDKLAPKEPPPEPLPVESTKQSALGERRTSGIGRTPF